MGKGGRDKIPQKMVGVQRGDPKNRGVEMEDPKNGGGDGWPKNGGKMHGQRLGERWPATDGVFGTFP